MRKDGRGNVIRVATLARSRHRRVGKGTLLLVQLVFKLWHIMPMKAKIWAFKHDPDVYQSADMALKLYKDSRKRYEALRRYQ